MATDLTISNISQTELQVYEAVLELKEPTVLNIAKKSKTPRTNAYRLLESIERKGLVSSVISGKRKQYIPEPPSRLIENLKQQERSFQKEMPRLKELYSMYRNRPSTRLFEGEAGMRTFWEEALKDRPKEIWCYLNIDDLFARYPEFPEQFTKRRARLKIPGYIIAPDSSLTQERKKLGPEELRYIKILPKNTTPLFHSSIMAWKDKVALFSFAHDDVAVLAESPEISFAMQTLLKTLWGTLN